MRIKKTSQTTTTQAQVVDGYSTSTIDSYSCNYANKCNTYSTNEIDTGKVWTDGKPIYRKVIEGTLPALTPSGGGTDDGNIAHGITNLDTIIQINGKLLYSNNWYFFPIISSSGKITGIRGYTSTNITIRSSDTWDAGPSVKLIVEYTKTTD